jgi:hypothetical protein
MSTDRYDARHTTPWNDHGKRPGAPSTAGFAVADGGAGATTVQSATGTRE